MSGPLSSRSTKPSIALTEQVAILLGARPGGGLRVSLLRLLCATRFGNAPSGGGARKLDASLEGSLRTLVRQGRATQDPAEPGRWRMLAPGERPASVPRRSLAENAAERVLALLPATSTEVQLAMGWTPPGARRHLSRMTGAGLVTRAGTGVKGDPYRYTRAGAAA